MKTWLIETKFLEFRIEFKSIFTCYTHTGRLRRWGCRRVKVEALAQKGRERRLGRVTFEIIVIHFCLVAQVVGWAMGFVGPIMLLLCYFLECGLGLFQPNVTRSGPTWSPGLYLFGQRIFSFVQNLYCVVCLF